MWVRDVLVKWSGGLPLEVRFRFCCVRWWWIKSRFRYRRVLVYARPALLSSRFGGLGSYAKQWIPFSGRRGEPFKVWFLLFFFFELLSDFFYYCQKRDDKISCVGCQYWIANKIGSIHFVSPSHWRRHYRRFSPSDTDFCKVWSSLYS